MGTGIVNTLLFLLPWHKSHAAFRAIGAAFLLFDIVLFLAFATITILRYAFYPRFFVVMVLDNTHSLFLGTIPMGLVTIISGIATEEVLQPGTVDVDTLTRLFTALLESSPDGQ